MEKDAIYTLLEQVERGEIAAREAFSAMKELPYSDLGYAKVDNHRALRTGHNEVIYCEGKQPDQIRGIVSSMLESGNKNILATRCAPEIADMLREDRPDTEYHSAARIAVVNPDYHAQPPKAEGKILIVTGGTADIPVAEEAAVTAAAMGHKVEKLYDVGVAGVHRLLANTGMLREGNVIIAVAGMEGALASVVGGLVDRPVIAVPTSVGYGANFGGLSALLSMLNSCASGVSVVNIDNGFGAGYLAAMINEMGG